MTCVFNTSLEVEVEVFSEAIQTGERKLTSKAYLTFVSLDQNGKPAKVPPLLIETPEDEQRCRDAPGATRRAPEKKSGA